MHHPTSKERGVCVVGNGGPLRPPQERFMYAAVASWKTDYRFHYRRSTSSIYLLIFLQLTPTPSGSSNTVTRRVLWSRLQDRCGRLVGRVLECKHHEVYTDMGCRENPRYTGTIDRHTGGLLFTWVNRDCHSSVVRIDPQTFFVHSTPLTRTVELLLIRTLARSYRLARGHKPGTSSPGGNIKYRIRN